jgi:predicted esterase
LGLAGVPVAAQQLGDEEAQREWPRYELGRRMRAFERVFAQADLQARKRALSELEAAVASFFRNDAPAGGRSIDAARRALESEEALQDRARAWADGLALVPARRCIEPGDSKLELELVQFHAQESAPQPEGDLRLRAALVEAGGERRGALDVEIAQVPATFPLELKGLKKGDHTLEWTIGLGERALSGSAMTISAVRDASARIEATFAVSSGYRETHAELEATTLRGRLGLLRPLFLGGCDETDLPAARLIDEAEQMTAALKKGERWFDASRAGEHWMRLPMESSVQPVRLLIPPDRGTDDLRPLVVALHGAGGSENIFFDSYGDGLAVELARQRGWYLVTPRATLLHAPDVAAIVELLAARLPIDRERIALLGHSLGADHALQALNKGLRPCAAAALLSGGWMASPSGELESMPFWLGAGERDFGLEPTRQLAQSLRAAGVEHVTLREVEATEHMTVVQIALPEVFAFLDDHLGGR